MATTVSIQQWASAKEPIAIKQFMLALGRDVNDRRNLFWDVAKSDKMRETYFDEGDIGTVPEFGGALAYDTWVENYEQFINNREYAKGLRIEYKFIRTDQQRVVQDGSKLLGLAMRRRIAGDAVSCFNGAFDASFLTRDGLSLCNSAHTSNITATTQSNRGTLAFSAVALEATRILMRKFKSNNNNELEIMPDMIVGPVELDGPFQEVTKSDYQTNSANNNINIHQGKYTAITDVRITDSNNWFVIDKALMKQFQKWQEVDPVDYKRDTDFDSRAAKYACWAFYGTGSTGWEWVYGHNVA